MHSINPHTFVVRHVLAVLCISVLLTGCGLASRNGSVDAGLKYQANGEYRAAYIEAKKVLQRDNKNGDAWLLLGQASLRLGNPKDALSDLESAKANNVSEERWAVPMGQALLATGQYDQLLKTLAADRPFEPKVKARVAVLRGDAYRGLGQLDQARTAYQAALTSDSKNPGALVGLAKLESIAHDANAASNHVQQALAAAPDNPQALVAKADLAFESGDLAGAEATYQKVLGFKNPDWLPQERFYALTRRRSRISSTRRWPTSRRWRRCHRNSRIRTICTRWFCTSKGTWTMPSPSCNKCSSWLRTTPRHKCSWAR